MMSALYCFAERQQELFTEALARGFLASMQDWPRNERTLDDAMEACAALRLETCCVSDEIAYRSMTESAWMSAYRSGRDVTGRDGFILAYHLRDIPFDEAIRGIRASIVKGSNKEQAQRAYRQYQEALAALLTNAFL